MVIKSPIRLAIDGDAVLKEAANRIGHASQRAQPASGFENSARPVTAVGQLALLSRPGREEPSAGVICMAGYPPEELCARKFGSSRITGVG